MTVNAKGRFSGLSGETSTFARMIRPVRLMFKFFLLFKLALWRAFEHDAYTIAKASAYSCILSFFPALLVLGAVLASSQRFEIYVREISYVLGRMLPAGSNAAVHYLRSNNDRPVRFLVTTSLLTVWLASGVVVSWMEGFRNAYQLPKIWGLVKERAIACALVILAGIPMTVATILVAFGGQIENRAMVLIGHRLGPLILLMGSGIRWLVAILTGIAVIAVIYHNAVPRTHRWHCVLPGASLATGMWFGATVLFSWYLNQFGEYSEIYGQLAVGIALLIWMFLISLIVLVGAEFNALLFPRALPRRPVAEEEPLWRTAA
jgi:membrane protein